MAKTRVQKEEELQQITDNLNKARAVVFVDYQQSGGSQQAGTSGSKGMSMKQLSDLRHILREQNARLIITKNTLLKLALQTTNYQLPTTNFHGPTATLFAFDDEISPIKALVKAIKDSAIGKIKAGFLGVLGVEPLSEARIMQLATLPTKNELRAKTVGILVAPLQGMVGVLQANLRNLVYALSEMSKLPTVEQKVKGGV